MQFVLFGDVAFYYGGVAFMEISQQLQQLLVAFVDSSNEVRQLVLLKILAKSSQAVLHKLVHLYRIVVLV